MKASLALEIRKSVPKLAFAKSDIYVLHLVGKQAYKIELPKKWGIYDIFYVSLLE